MDTNEPKISANRQKKEAVVSKIAEKLEKAKTLVFTNYRGLTHQQLENLKKKLRTMDAEMAVTKNTLLKLALEKSGNKKAVQEEVFEQPTATMFIYSDPVEPLKQLAKVIKELNLPSVKFGLLDNKLITAEQVLRLATLPSREVLIAQLLGNMKYPISGLVNALNWNLKKLAMTLKAIEKTKEVN